MAKLAQNFAKYMIHAIMEASGTVEKPDVIGAVFGQTEGLLGQDLDLRELQKTGRIGRIEVKLKTVKGNTEAEITIPSSLDASETSLIAAALETIEKVGPCNAKISIGRVEDVRTHKRRYVVDRAKDILKDLVDDSSDSQNLAEHIRESVRSYEISSWEGLSCGPDAVNSDELIVVEGRADVINLVKNGIRNCIAIEGSNVPEQIAKLCKEKVVTALLDGDRGGDLILRKLLDIAEIDFVARADEGLEVEELTKKQLFKSIRDKVPIAQVIENMGNMRMHAHETMKEAKETREDETESGIKITPEMRKQLLKYAEQLIGTRAVFLLDASGKLLSKMPMGELSILIHDYHETQILVVDGKINQDLVDMALQRRIKCLVGTSVSDDIKCPKTLALLTPEKLNAVV